MNKDTKRLIKLISFTYNTGKTSIEDIIKFLYYKEYKLKRNILPLTGITGYSIVKLIEYDLLSPISVGLSPFIYFVPRAIIKNKIYTKKNKRYEEIFINIGLQQGGKTPYLIKEDIIEKEDFNFKKFLKKRFNLLKKNLGIDYKLPKERKKFKLFFHNHLTLNDWSRAQERLQVQFNTNIESIYFWKNYKTIAITCNSQKVNYEKIYSNTNLELIERFKACIDSLGLRYKIDSYDNHDFSYIIRILTRNTLKEFQSVKNEFCHRVHFNEEKLNIYSEKGLIVFKFSLDMKTLSFIEEYRNLTKTTMLTKKKLRIPIYIGKNEEGRNIVFDLLDYYHWLIAGSTGQGKSNLLNVILSCILLNRNKIAKYYLLDPKKVELSRYKHIKNVIYKNEQDDILRQLLELQNEMINRYKLFESRNVLDIDEWNEKFPNEKIGYIVIIIDEIANLMLSEEKKTFHDVLQKLGQEARGAGFRIVLVTQCANGNVIKETIKINYINRVCMQVDNWTSSKVILDDKIGTTLKNPGEIILKLNNNLDKIKVPLISKKEIPKIIEGIERINGLNE